VTKEGKAGGDFFTSVSVFKREKWLKQAEGGRRPRGSSVWRDIEQQHTRRRGISYTRYYRLSSFIAGRRAWSSLRGQKFKGSAALVK